MRFTVLIPARLAASRLPNKPLADLAGKPMVVRVAERAMLSGAERVVVATDAPEVLQACQSHGIEAVLTAADHPSGSDRLAEASTLIGLEDEALIVNVQGDEPLIEPELINAVASLLASSPGVPMSTAAHAIDSLTDFINPNVVKVTTDKNGLALSFSRAPMPWFREASQAAQPALPLDPPALRHVGIYGYRAGFLREFPKLPQAPIERCESLEQMRVLWHGQRIAVHISPKAPGAGVDTPEDLARMQAWFEQNAA